MISPAPTVTMRVFASYGMMMADSPYTFIFIGTDYGEQEPTFYGTCCCVVAEVAEDG